MRRREQFENLSPRQIKKEVKERQDLLHEGTLYPSDLCEEIEELCALYEELTGDELETDF